MVIIMDAGASRIVYDLHVTCNEPPKPTRWERLNKAEEQKFVATAIKIIQAQAQPKANPKQN